MAAQSLLAKLGLRLGTLGSAASLAFAYPLAANDPSMAAHTDANRIGTYADRTPGAEKVGHIIQGTEVLSVGVASIVAAVPLSTPASVVGAAGLNIGQGVAPTAPANGDVWITAAGFFFRSAGATLSAGTVTSVSVTTANGVSGSVATSTSTPAITLTLGAITPSSVAATGLITGTNLRSGTGSPEGAVTAAVGSLFERTDGGTGTTLYVKETGAGNTGWVAQAGGAGTVTSVSVTTANGVSGSVATATTTPAITLTLGAITPSSVASTGLITGTNLRSGTGSPEGVVTAAVGSVFERTDGGTGTTLYIKETGAGNTGWVAVSAGGSGTIGGSIASGQVAFGSGANTIQGSATLAYTATTGLAIAPTAVATGVQTALTVTGAANTNQTASTEAIGVNLNLSATVQFATGALTTQRATVVQAPTYGFVGASTITSAATLAVTAAPIAGTNATITNSYAFWVQAGKSNFGGSVLLPDGTFSAGSMAMMFASDTSIGIYKAATGALGVNAGNSFMLGHTSQGWKLQTGAITTPTASAGRLLYLLRNGNLTALTASTEQTDVEFAPAAVFQFATGALTTQRSWLITANTYSFVGASVITTAATLAISGAPAAGTNATITNAYAFWVQGGISQFDGLVRTTASTTGTSGFNLPHGAAPTAPVNGDLWTTTTAMFVRINGVTQQLGTGTGTIGGSIASGQVAVGSGANTVAGASTLVWTSASGFSSNRSGAARSEYFGLSAGNATATGTDCTAVGASAGLALTGGTDNTLIGSRAGTAVLGGASNTAVGSTALFANTTGSDNTAIGVGAQAAATGLQQTTFVGSSAGNRWGSDRTVGIGYQAIRGGSASFASNSGTNNVAIGYQALRDLTSGDQNVAIGDSAMLSANSGDANRNVAIGYQSLLVIDGNTSTSNDNVAVGYQTLVASTTAAQMVAIGSGALKTGSTGIGLSVAVGYNALTLATGTRNTAIGASAGAVTTSGTDNIFIGASAGDATAVGASNRFVAGSNVTTISNVWFGKGEVNASPTAYSINGTGGSGANVAGADINICGGAGTGTGAGGGVVLRTATLGGSSSTLNALVTRLTCDGAGNVVIGTAALATTATDGYFYATTCAGTPTGVPTTFTGRAAIQIDTTAGKFWAYYGGAWHFALLT